MTTKKTALSPTERKRLQRQRDRAAGWVEVTVKVAADQVANIRRISADLPPPPTPCDPSQLDLLAALDEKLGGSTK